MKNREAMKTVLAALYHSVAAIQKDERRGTVNGREGLRRVQRVIGRLILAAAKA